jgi:hypothetical protein
LGIVWRQSLVVEVVSGQCKCSKIVWFAACRALIYLLDLPGGYS